MAEATPNQRVKNAQIFAKLETMDDRLKHVEELSGEGAKHSIRCMIKWDQYEKDQKRTSDRLGKLEPQSGNPKILQAANNQLNLDKKLLAIIAALITAIIAVVQILSVLVQNSVGGP